MHAACVLPELSFSKDVCLATWRCGRGLLACAWYMQHAQGILHLRLLLQEAGICLALILLQLSVQGRLRHIGCHLQAINKTLSLVSCEQSGWLAQSASNSSCKSAHNAMLKFDVDHPAS
jgi:hypothetical protein